MMFKSSALTGVMMLCAAWSADAVCAEQDATCKNERGSALLQKDVRRNEGKVALGEEQFPASVSYGTATCSGKEMQGRCWLISEMGENCASACGKYGRRFSYVVADANDPVTPHLVGHIPNEKQEAWAALECYVPSEDRYHTANANAAKHFLDDIGSWSYENCKLACPCALVNDLPPATPSPPVSSPTPSPPNVATEAKCTWKQTPDCSSEFLYHGIAYHGCATVDSQHQKPWCQHHFQQTEEGAEQDWSYCTYDCGQEAPPTPVPTSAPQVCEWLPAYSCKKEYDYEGIHYVGCTATDHDTPWCSNTDPYTGSWNHCVYSCADKEDVVPPTTNIDTLCHWDMKPECAKAFNYKGVDYTTCITEDHPTPWCSLDSVHAGAWTTCTKVCNEATGHILPPATPAPAPITPPTEDPCTRHPEAENDILGHSVALDEAGYKMAAAADSPVNMKRFVCRVVDKIECRVTDLPSLVAFVPYYSGLISQQTYAHLQNELVTLCHAGGKWVVPNELA